MSDAGAVRQLGAFIAETRASDIPDAVVEKAKRHSLDTLGAALAGATSEEVRRTRVALSFAEPPGGGAQAWGSGDLLSPRNAALVNGIAAHAFELDDTGGCDHSGAVVLPAAIAALPLCGKKVDGSEFLAAVLLGYDVGRRVLEAFGGYEPHNQAGWHSTGTCGVFGAAAAAARLLGLNARQSADALGLAASFSSGLWAFIHDGAMAKRVHAGRAAEGGLLAALLAMQGVTGPQAVFADRWGGFLKTYGHGPVDAGALTAGLGERWRIMRCSIKPYASCRDTHAGVDAIGRILDRTGLAAGGIKRIEAMLSPFLNGMVGGHDVATLAAAQMSLPYALAARVVLGRNGLSAYAPESRADPRVAAIMARVAIVLDEAVLESDAAMIAVETEDGRRFEEPTRIALGAPENPLDDARLLAKFTELAAYVLPPPAVTALAERMMTLDAMADARDLPALLRACSLQTESLSSRSATS